MNLKRDNEALAERKGSWQQTFSGKAYHACDPRPEDVCLEDIAHALARQCRFGGHCREFYSVAEHSIYVSQVVPIKWGLTALLHDATEAYCVDVPRPLKPFLMGYKEIEELNWLAIAEHFGISPEMPDCVKDADSALLLVEKTHLMSPEPAPWTFPPISAEYKARAAGVFGPGAPRLSPSAAEQYFLTQFARLTA